MTGNNGTQNFKRGEFPDGEATVLVLDHFQGVTWESYGARVPEECNLLFVRDTAAAEKAMHENPAIGVVIVQGMSRRATHPMVDNLAGKGKHERLFLMTWLEARLQEGEPVFDWLDNYQHTVTFLKSLQQQGFEGLVQVVSRSLQGYEWRELLDVEGLRVQGMDKQDFFEGSFTSKVEGLWKRIAAYERLEDGTKRPLRPNSVATRYIDQLLGQAIYPHPAEDRLYERWFAREQSKALEDVLTWLEELKLTVASGDVRAIYCRVAQMPERPGACECSSLAGSPDSGWWLSFHFLHNEFNRAVWEILDMAGLTDWMRLELELDLASRNPTCPEFGHHMRRDSGYELREFFRPEGPSEQWVRF